MVGPRRKQKNVFHLYTHRTSSAGRGRQAGRQAGYQSTLTDVWRKGRIGATKEEKKRLDCCYAYAMSTGAGIRYKYSACT